MLAKKAKLTRRMDRTAVISRLREQIRRMEADFARCQRRQWFSTSLLELDERLVGGGLPSASIVELLTAGRSGSCLGLAAWLSAQVLAGVGLARGGVVIDRRGELYPPAAAQMGLELDRLVLVRPRCEAEAVWAAEESLRSPGVGVVLVPWLWGMDHRQSRRLQLAAEAGGGVGLVVRSVRARGRISSAAVRLLVEPAPSEPGVPIHQGRWVERWSVQVLRCRGGPEAGLGTDPVVVGLDDATGDVSCDAAVFGGAGPATASRSKFGISG